MTRRTAGTGSIEQRGPNRWRITVFRGRNTESGEIERQRVTIRGTKKDAERALRGALSKHDRGIDVVPSKITTADWLTRWLNEHTETRGIEQSTRVRYDRVIRRQLIPALGTVKLQALRPTHVRTLYADSSLSVSARRRCHVVLSRALDDAVRAQLLVLNPARSVGPPSERRQRAYADEQRVLNEEELGSLLDHAEGTAHTVPIRLTLATGLRQGELLALRWADVDLDRAVLSVNRNLQVLPRTGVQFRPPKTRNARRAIEVSAATIALLRSHRRVQQEARLRLGPSWSDGGLVFPSLVGTPWLPSNFYRGYKTLVTRSEISKPDAVVWHTLRHTAATHWIKAGVELHVVSRRLGHASAAFTMDTYGHLLPGMQRQAAEVFDHLIAT